MVSGAKPATAAEASAAPKVRRQSPWHIQDPKAAKSGRSPIEGAVLLFLSIPSPGIQSEIPGDGRGLDWQRERSSTGFDDIHDPQ
jgi:hypothetical protein